MCIWSIKIEPLKVWYDITKFEVHYLIIFQFHLYLSLFHALHFMSILTYIFYIVHDLVWTLPWSIDRRDLWIKIVMWVWRKSVVFEFWKIHPNKGRFLFGVATYFLFLFLKWGKLSKNKNPPMTLVRKKRSAKLDFWVRGSGYLSGRYLIQGSTPLGPESGLY